MNTIQITENINVINNRKKILELLIDKLDEHIYKAGNYKLSPALKNMGNTCFHNSIMQLIYRVEELIPFITHDNIIGQYKDSTQLWYIIDIFKKMYLNIGNADFLNATDLENVVEYSCSIIPTYTPFQQADAGEFLILILSGLLPDCTSGSYLKIKKTQICESFYDPDAKSTLYKLNKKFPLKDPRNFYIQTQKEYFCKTPIAPNDDDINNISKNIRNKYILSCNVFKEGMTIKDVVLRVAHKDNDERTLDELIANNKTAVIVKREGDDKNFMYIKKTEILSANEYIFIQLNSFSYVKGKQHKINYKVPLSNPLIINSQKYDLVGISYHMGGTGGGHYIAYIKHNTGWYEYDDESRTQKPDNGQCKYQPYIMLYRRQSTKSFDTINPDNIKGKLEDYFEPI